MRRNDLPQRHREHGEENCKCKLRMRIPIAIDLHLAFAFSPCSLCPLWLFLLRRDSRAAAPQEVVVASRRRGVCWGVGVDDADGWRVAMFVAAKRLAVRCRLDELVRWGNPVLPRPQTIVVLADGGRLVTAADWSGGAAVRLEGETVVVLSDAFGEVRLPRSLVRGVVFAQRERCGRSAQRVGRDACAATLPNLAGEKDDAVLLDE